MDKDKKDTMPAFTKVPGYQQLQKIINPYSGFDFDKMRADLLKLKEASDKEKFDGAIEELRQKWWENEYKSLSLQEKLDMSLDHFVQLMHANVDKWMDRSMPPAAMSLMQSIMKDQNERARLAIEFMRLQLARDMQEQSKKTIKQVGYFPEDELEEPKDGSSSGTP